MAIVIKRDRIPCVLHVRDFFQLNVSYVIIIVDISVGIFYHEPPYPN